MAETGACAAETSVCEVSVRPGQVFLRQKQILVCAADRFRDVPCLRGRTAGIAGVFERLCRRHIGIVCVFDVIYRCGAALILPLGALQRPVYQGAVQRPVYHPLLQEKQFRLPLLP